MRGSKRFHGIPEDQQVLHRFMLKVEQEPNSGCWLWSGAADRDCGYGVFWRDGMVHKAHRIAYELFNGTVPDDGHVLHRCDTPYCVNPDHLFIGDSQLNALDRASKDRGSKSKSGLPYGVYVFGRRFVARVSVGTRRHLGVFDTPEEAALVAATEKKRTLRKEMEGSASAEPETTTNRIANRGWIDE